MTDAELLSVVEWCRGAANGELRDPPGITHEQVRDSSSQRTAQLLAGLHDALDSAKYVQGDSGAADRRSLEQSDDDPTVWKEERVNAAAIAAVLETAARAACREIAQAWTGDRSAFIATLRSAAKVYLVSNTKHFLWLAQNAWSASIGRKSLWASDDGTKTLREKTQQKHAPMIRAAEKCREAHPAWTWSRIHAKVAPGMKRSTFYDATKELRQKKRPKP
jgi:hypothetical protein